MIGIFDNAGARIAHTFNGLTFNSPSDPLNNRYETDIVVPATAITQMTEPHPANDGSEAWGAYKSSRIEREYGTIRAPSLAALHDKIATLAAACDPAKIVYDNGAAASFLPLDFSVPTADLTTYPSGLIASRYYARPHNLCEPVVSSYTGYSALYAVDWYMADPRRYLQGASTLAGAGTADNTKANYHSYPTITITATGAGSATYTIGNSTVGKSLVLNLSSLVNTDVVVVDMAHAKITKSGVETPSLYVSGAYWEIKPGNNVITVTNPTNVTTVTSWRSAFVL